MDALGELYYGAVAAYNTIYPWIPLPFRASAQTLLARVWLLIHTSPSDMQHMIPTLVSTIALVVSIYWTITTAYFAVRKTVRVVYFLLKYGSIILVSLGVLGWMSPADPNGAVTISGAIGSGWHACVGFFDELQQAYTAESTRGAPGKPWERFTSRNDHSSNPRPKARKPKSRSRPSATKFASSQPQRGAPATNPFADFGIADALGWLSKLRQGGNGENKEWEEGEFARKMRDVWQKNRGAWESLKFDAFKPQFSGEEGTTSTDDAWIGNEDDRGQTELR